MTPIKRRKRKKIRLSYFCMQNFLSSLHYVRIWCRHSNDDM